ncbi:MAG: twin-arginine translocase subunit TatB [Acidobacteria bacterium]|nr:MAG: twin-arginine translocase subunit TatB [Acidobacteriota bacterium]
MFLFIFESIGTSELLLVGVVALIFLGPRRLPEIARKIGKIMAEFRTTTQEFKSTWEREVNFEEEAKAFKLDPIEEELAEQQAREFDTSQSFVENTIGAPEVKQIDKESFDRIAAENNEAEVNMPSPESTPEEADVLSDKRHWL